MYRPKAPNGPHLFSSAKTPAPVPARHPALREALVIASLDAAVRSISHVASATVGTAEVTLDAIVLARDDGRFHLDVVPARRVRNLDDEGLFRIGLSELHLAPLLVSAADLSAEPQRSNCRAVWSYKDRPVPAATRIGILKLVADEGPLEFGRLVELIRSDRDPSASVLALAYSDLLELDLASLPLAPMTVARFRT